MKPSPTKTAYDSREGRTGQVDRVFNLSNRLKPEAKKTGSEPSEATRRQAELSSETSRRGDSRGLNRNSRGKPARNIRDIRRCARRERTPPAAQPLLRRCGSCASHVTLTQGLKETDPIGDRVSKQR